VRDGACDNGGTASIHLGKDCEGGALRGLIRFDLPVSLNEQFPDPSPGSGDTERPSPRSTRHQESGTWSARSRRR
jgi:hypothetical protein